MSSNFRVHGPLDPNAMRRDDPHPDTYFSQSTASKTTVDPRRHAPTFKHNPVTTPGATSPPPTSSSSAHHGNSMAWPPPKDPNLRDYKVIFDPFINGRRGESSKDFLYRYNGQVGPGEDPIRVRDPRRDLSERNREGRGRARLRTYLYQLEYEYDENSYGPPPPPPPRAICVSGLSPFTAAGFVKRHFSSYGVIEEFISQVDKANGSSLGLFWVKFSDEDEDGHKAAQRAVQNEDGRKIGSGNAAQPATVVFDAEGQVCRGLYQEEMERRRKAWEENRRGNKASVPSNSPPHPIPAPLPPAPPPIPGLPSRPPPPTSGPVTGPDRTSLATAMRPPNPPKPKSSTSSTPNSRNSSLRPNHTPAIPSPLHSASPVSNASPKNIVNEKLKTAPVPATPTPAQPVDEEENHRDTLRLLALNGNDYIQIEKSSLPDESKAVEMEIRRFFGGYKVDRVMRDIHGWYISFDVSTDARRALAALDDKTIAGRQVILTVHPAPSIATLATTSSRPRGDAKEWSETEFIQEARKIIMRDLLSVFAKDLRERVARPKTWKLVDEALEAHRAFEEKETEDVPPPTSESVTPGIGGGIPGEVSVSTPKGLKGLSFKRQHQNVKVDINIFNRLTPQNRINLLNILNKKNATSESEIPISLPSPPPPVPEPVTCSPPKPKSVPAAAIIDDESDENVARFERSLKRRKAGIERPEHKKKRPRRRVEFSDSDRSDEEEVGDSPEPAPVPKARPPTKPLRDKPRKPPAPKLDVVVTPPVSDEPKPKEVEIPKPKAAVPVPIPILPPPSPTPGDVKVPDPYTQQLVDDEEDLYYIRLALGQERGIPLPARCIQRPPEEDTSHYPLGLRKHVTGSARTEGYYKIPEAAKSLYLPQRNRAIVDISAAAPMPAATSRSNRANSRRLAQGIEQHKGKAADAGDVLKFNQLRTRKKQLTFARSPIHDWGLYAAEVIPAGDMVIEYVGEVIRQQVADKREKYYEKTGIGSSYLFRVDDDSVVDATKKGNLGRLINHCCAPNCTAKIITINGEKKIVIYAKSNIDIGDEITYGMWPLITISHSKIKRFPVCAVHRNVEVSSTSRLSFHSFSGSGHIQYCTRYRRIEGFFQPRIIFSYIPALAVHGPEKFALKAVYSRSKSSSSSLAALAKERLGASPAIYSEDGASEGGLDAILARSDIQAVIVVLPLTQQPDIVIKALAAGKNVLSEKPVAKDVKTGIDLIEKWEKEYKPKGLIWRVAENFEVEPGVLEAVEPGVLEAGKRIQAGAIGKVRFFNFSMIFPIEKDNKYYQTSWRTVPDYQGGFLLDAGVHTNAALRRVLGSSFPLDTAKVSSFASLTRDYLAPHDTFQAVIQAAPTSDGHPPHGAKVSSFASLTRDYLAPHDTFQAVIQAAPTSDGHPPHGINEMSCATRPGFSRYILTVTGTEGTLTLQSVPKPVKEADLILARSSAFNSGNNEKPVVPHWQVTITGSDGSKTEEFDRISSGVYEELGNLYNALSGKDDGNGEPRDALLDVALTQAFLTSQGNPVDMKKLLSTGSA
ncbi:unnamed protein product [Rhizoctonia solani]|uniref:Histone-lysine N-methyltransferase, H3 lysine-4 specific n=1 Tax=Rhizoctonia solani TaxID=456999 RepID=A0A8H2XRC1_9AGAM|nr:unnamed protein product [Rhizoctonia solani]